MTWQSLHMAIQCQDLTLRRRRRRGWRQLCYLLQPWRAVPEVAGLAGSAWRLFFLMICLAIVWWSAWRLFGDLPGNCLVICLAITASAYEKFTGRSCWSWALMHTLKHWQSLFLRFGVLGNQLLQGNATCDFVLQCCFQGLDWRNNVWLFLMVTKVLGVFRLVWRFMMIGLAIHDDWSGDYNR